MHHASKPRAILGFLLSYGWAFAIVVLALATLNHLGILDAHPPTASNCRFPPGSGLSCASFSTDSEGNVHLALTQATGEGIALTGFGCGASNPDVLPISPVFIANGSSALVPNEYGFPCPDAFGGGAFRGQISVRYFTASSPFDLGATADATSPAAAHGVQNTTFVGQCPYTLNATGTYALTQDLVSAGTCIAIGPEANGSTLDCFGHSITGSGEPNQRGVYSYNNSNVTIQNCLISGFDTPVYLHQAIRGTLVGNTLSAAANGGSALYAYGANGAAISGNTLAGSGIGAWLSYSRGIALSGNRVANNSRRGIALIQSQFAAIAQNTVEANAGVGIEVSGADTEDVNLTDNRVRYNGNGILIGAGAEDVRLTGNDVRFNQYADLNVSAPASAVHFAGNSFCSLPNGGSYCTAAQADAGGNACRNGTACGIMCRAC